MTRPGSASAPKGAAGGVDRPSRRSKVGARGPAWLRPYKRAQKALDSAAGLIFSTVYAVIDAGKRAARRPLHTAQRLVTAVRQLTVATERYMEARRALDEAVAALALLPEDKRAEAYELLTLAEARYEAVAKYIPIAMEEVLLAQVEILGGVATGDLVAEQPDDDGLRRRIAVKAHPLFVRAYLASRRQPRVSDRITPALMRRRRTPRPAEVRVPRRSLRGRAPPLSSTCAL